MKLFRYFIPIAAVFILSSLSCKTTPPDPQPVVHIEEEAEPVSAPVSEPVTAPASGSVSIAESVSESTQVTEQTQPLQEELNTAISRAGEARTRAQDFDGSSYFPSDWEAAEEQYTLAGQLLQNNDNDVRGVIDAYTASANSFDSVFNLTIPLYAQAREDEIMTLREYLIEQGIKQYYPEYLTPADNAALLALDQFEAEDYYSARESAAGALTMFNTITIAYEALLKKWEIDERDFLLYDMDNYELAGETLTEAIDAYNTGDFTQALSKAEEANSYYGAVLSAGWAGYADIRSMQAASERQAALDTRADIGAREYFEIADSSNAIALELLEEQKYEDAAKVFHYAEAMYVIASMSSVERRRTAAAAIMEANERIQASDTTALEAETIIEGGP